MRPAARLLNKDFTLLWQGQALGQFGTSISTIAVVLWIKQATESAPLLGFIMMLSGLPRVFLGTLGGGFADRFARRNVIVLCDTVSMLIAFSTAGMLAASSQPNRALLLGIAALAIAVSSTQSLLKPAVLASIPDLVPRQHLEGANTLHALTQQLFLLLGRAIGGVLFRWLGMALLVFFSGLNFLSATIMMTFVHIPQKLTRHAATGGDLASSFAASIREGLVYAWDRIALRRLLFAAATTRFLLHAIIILLPFYVEDQLGARPDWYGYLFAFLGSGVALGAGAASYLRLTGSRRAWAVIVLFTFNAFNGASLGLIHSVMGAGGMALVIGSIMGFTEVSLLTILQQGVPAEMRGRVFGLLETVVGAAVPLGMGFGGLAFDLSGQSIPIVYIGCGVTMGLSLILIVSNREFRAFLAGAERE